MGLMLSLVAFGLGGLVVANPIMLGALKWGGIAFLLWLTWQIATAGRHDGAAEHDLVGFWRAAAFQWVNPKSWLVSASAAGAYLSAGATGVFVQAALFGILFVLAALPSCFVWLAFGATVQRLLRTERAARRFNLVMAATLAGSILLFVR
jgi:threonine/homoserine/homoserine lactone efflux protein